MKRLGIWRAVGFPAIGISLAVVLALAGAPARADGQASASPAAAPAPASDSASQPGPAAGGVPAARVYMPDGQLKSHAIRIYISRDIQPGQNPRLRLLRNHGVAEKETEVKPGVVAPGQQWTQSLLGQDVPQTGTLLLFDLSGMEFGLRAMLRVRPVVSWTEDGRDRIVVGDSEVNVGSIQATVGWTTLVVGVALLVVILLSRQSGGSPLRFLAGVDGHLSLAQTQIACWTLVIGGVVLGYGFVALQIPHIPESLLALMGASLATGGIGFFSDARNRQAAIDRGAAPVRHPMALGDLVRDFSTGDASELSLAKAQMLFWTVLLLVLFLSKSIQEGAIWDVPWALVALMGFSQAGFLAPKLAPPAGSAGSAAGVAPPADTP